MVPTAVVDVASARSEDVRRTEPRVQEAEGRRDDGTVQTPRSSRVVGPTRTGMGGPSDGCLKYLLRGTCHGPDTFLPALQGVSIQRYSVVIVGAGEGLGQPNPEGC